MKNSKEIVDALEAIIIERGAWRWRYTAITRAAERFTGLFAGSPFLLGRGDRAKRPQGRSFLRFISG